MRLCTTGGLCHLRVRWRLYWCIWLGSFDVHPHGARAAGGARNDVLGRVDTPPAAISHATATSHWGILGTAVLPRSATEVSQVHLSGIQSAIEASWGRVARAHSVTFAFLRMLKMAYSMSHKYEGVTRDPSSFEASLELWGIVPPGVMRDPRRYEAWYRHKLQGILCEGWYHYKLQGILPRPLTTILPKPLTTTHRTPVQPPS